MKTSPCRLALPSSLKTTLVAALSVTVFLAPRAQAQTTILKNNTSGANQLDLTNAWVGGVVPGPSDTAAFGTNNTATSGSLNIGDGVSFRGILATGNPGAGFTITNNSTNTTSVMVLGASGIDWSATQQVDGTNRVLNVNPLLVLTNDQTWTTGLGLANTTQITASNTISGPGRLTIAGTAGATNAAVFLQNSNNSFSGGLVLNAGGTVRFSGAATASGGAVTGSTMGTGNLTINGGTIFGGGSVLGPANVTINGDFAVNVGGTNVSINGRLSIGGTMDLGGATRTVTLGNYRTFTSGSTNVLTGGVEAWRFFLITNAGGGGPAVQVTNGTFRFVRDPSGTASDYIAVNFSQSNNFTSGSGFVIGSNVVTTLATGNPFGSVAGNQPHVTIEAGGLFNLADAANLRSPTIRTLAGDGVVTALATNTNGTVTLTVNPQAGDLATFTGSIANGVSFTNLLANTNLQARVAFTKTGAGTQVLDGTNTYTGNTAVSAGLLELGTNGVLTFVISPGTNNAVTGSGSALFRGKFQFDLANATTNNGDSWTIVATNTTKSYDGNFQVVGFTNSGGTWTRGTNGVFYQFAQSNSVLSVTTNAPPTGGYAAWVSYWQGIYTNFTSTAGTDNPDGDPFNNNMEFAFDGNPAVGSPALLTAIKVGTNAVFNYVAQTNTNTVTYLVQSTTDLTIGWTNASVTISNSANQGGISQTNLYERKEFVVPAAGKTFYRVRSTIAP